MQLFCRSQYSRTHANLFSEHLPKIGNYPTGPLVPPRFRSSLASVQELCEGVASATEEKLEQLDARASGERARLRKARCEDGKKLLI